MRGVVIQHIVNTDPKVIADRFCKYFIYFGPRLASTTPAVSYNFRSFLINNNNNPIIFKPTTIIEVENISKTLASTKAPGYEHIPMHVIKSSFQLISSPLANIINQSRQRAGHFPRQTENC